MNHICLTNDDGPQSYGLLKLAESLKEKSKLSVIVPHRQRSGTGKALTLDRPIRIVEDSENDGYRFLVHDGFPADSVIFALSQNPDINLFVSGINSGANLGYHRMLTSGTVGAVLEAALLGYPALAVSMAVEPKYWFTQKGNRKGLEYACTVTSGLVDRILENGLPVGIPALNLTFPKEPSSSSEIVVVDPSVQPVRNLVEERTDPYGRSYYWIRGGEKESPKGQEAREVLVNGNIVLSPLTIWTEKSSGIQKLKSFLEL
ncbi:MAG: 5'/3'-nucleotidase SurE [Candidatus Thorarchaeota archaeon]